MTVSIVVGVLAIQGAFYEHFKLLQQAAGEVPGREWTFNEIRTPKELEQCDALIIPGGESTTVALVAARSHLLDPLRDFVKYGSPQCNFSWDEASLTSNLLQSETETHMGNMCWLDTAS